MNSNLPISEKLPPHMVEQMAEHNRLNAITFDKHLRLKIHDLIVELRARPGSPERTLAFRALQMARHWMGEDLAILGNASPYPNGTNPANTIVDPPADVTCPDAEAKRQAAKLESLSAECAKEHSEKVQANQSVTIHAPECGCPSCAIVTEVFNRKKL